MMSDINDFDLIKIADSTLIYRDLAAGKIIPKQRYHDLRSELIDNQNYTLLFKHQSHFYQLYQHIGFELILDGSGEFFYIKDAQDLENNEADENAFKVQVVLLILGRYFSRSGRDLELLSTPDMGVDETDITSLNDDAEYSDILRAARFKNGVQEALDYITSRCFAYKMGDKRYFLSDAGNAFLLRLVIAYEKSGLE